MIPTFALSRKPRFKGSPVTPARLCGVFTRGCRFAGILVPTCAAGAGTTACCSQHTCTFKACSACHLEFCGSADQQQDKPVDCIPTHDCHLLSQVSCSHAPDSGLSSKRLSPSDESLVESLVESLDESPDVSPDVSPEVVLELPLGLLLQVPTTSTGPTTVLRSAGLGARCERKAPERHVSIMAT